MPSYVNRVHDLVAAAFVRWTTATVDSGGASYPGPDAFGSTQDYCLETIIPTGAGAVGLPTEVLETDQLTNDSGVTVFQGQAIKINGDLTFDLADEDGAIAFVNQASILNGASGDVAMQGAITIPSVRQEGVWTPGDTVYLSKVSSGDLTNVIPIVDGDFDSSVGECVNLPAGGDAVMIIRLDRTLELLPIEFV